MWADRGDRAAKGGWFGLFCGGKKGARVCLAAREFGLLTRPIRDTIVLMPPLCATEEELVFAVEAIKHAVEQVFAAMSHF